MYPFRCFLSGCLVTSLVMMIAAVLMPYPRRIAFIVLGVAVFGLELNAKLSLYHQRTSASNCSNVRLSVEDRCSEAVSHPLQRLPASLSITTKSNYSVQSFLLLKHLSSCRDCKRGLLRAAFAQNHCPSLHLRPPPFSIPPLDLMPNFKA